MDGHDGQPPAGGTGRVPSADSLPRAITDLFETLTDPARERVADATADSLETPATSGDLHAREPEPYLAFYGLAEPAFASSSDPRFFCRGPMHDGASQRLLSAIGRHEDVVVLTGAAGTGKTTLCRTVLEELDRRTLTSFVADPSVSAMALLKQILSDFGVLSRGDRVHGPVASEQDLMTTLQSFAESLAPLGASALIVIDNAHNLTDDALDQLGGLAESAKASRPLQLILVGEPSLDDSLRRPEHQRLQRRATVQVRLDALPPNELSDYIVHRLGIAGCSRAVFDRSAVSRIHELSHGNPRAANRICDRALVRGFEISAEHVTTALVDIAAEDLGLIPVKGGTSPAVHRLLTVAALAVCAIAGALVAGWIFRDTVARLLASWHLAP
ncbi:MAG TPA: AAA family ATPase [Vicinamibacterales bacterium]